ncbi:helix-turn-helix transcriptional regulator [Hoeflea sp.]|uniref:helix-turn-helix transcriptional regulator n=1 Tax=Hoeflea sp. TaxID=1940281 RepID=UPI003B0250A7
MQFDIPTSVLSLVYEAATHNSKWVDFCSALNQVSGSPVKMFGHSTKSYESLGLIGAGWDPEGLDQYHQYYAALNPWMKMNLALPVGAVGVSDIALRRDELVKTEFYNDWLRHQEDIIAGPAMICYRSPDRFVAMVAACRRGGVDNALPQMTELLQALSPHITHAITISSALAGGNGVSAGHLDSSPHAIFLINRSGKVGFHNSAAQTLLRHDRIVKVSTNGCLTTNERAFGSHLETCMGAIQDGSFDALPGPKLFRSKRFGNCLLHAHIFPPSASHSFPEAVWTDPVAGALVITGSLGLNGGGDFEAIAKALGASRAEARLAAGLMRGLSLYQYADANNLSRYTVRNQVRGLLAKTGTSSQMQLLHKLHSLASPFTWPLQ